MKNLRFAIDSLRGVRGDVSFHIYGPIEDRDYWKQCQLAARRLEPNVSVHYSGVLRPHEVAEALAGYDVFFLPTMGENFGHAIVEALLAGCPVIISDRTPWRDLQAQLAGWDLPVSDAESFRRQVQACVDMGPQEMASWSIGARRLGDRMADNPEVAERYRTLFRQALSSSGGRA